MRIRFPPMSKLIKSKPFILTEYFAKSSFCNCIVNFILCRNNVKEIHKSDTTRRCNNYNVLHWIFETNAWRMFSLDGPKRFCSIVLLWIAISYKATLSSLSKLPLQFFVSFNSIFSGKISLKITSENLYDGEKRKRSLLYLKAINCLPFGNDDSSSGILLSTFIHVNLYWSQMIDGFVWAQAKE